MKISSHRFETAAARNEIERINKGTARGGERIKFF